MGGKKKKRKRIRIQKVGLGEGSRAKPEERGGERETKEHTLTTKNIGVERRDNPPPKRGQRGVPCQARLRRVRGIEVSIPRGGGVGSKKD